LRAAAWHYAIGEHRMHNSRAAAEPAGDRAQHKRHEGYQRAGRDRRGGGVCSFNLPHEEGDDAGAGRGGVEGDALPKSAGSSLHGRRKPNGSACQRRTMAGVQDEAKHAISAMSLLQSCDVEKPQPQR
jgi:hypothetical protein